MNRNNRTIAVRLGSEPALALRAGERLSAGRHRHVDVAVAFDTTGSMYNKIDGLVGCVSAMVTSLAQSGLDWRVTALPFGDLTIHGDTITDHLPWHSTTSAVDAMLRSMRLNSGGGNEGESSFEALIAAIEKPGREGALRVVLLITDEPPLTHAVTAATVERLVASADVLCNVVSPDLPSFRKLAATTGGKWLDVHSCVDLSSLIAEWTRLGDQMAVRARRVLELGGSPQQTLMRELGR